MEADASQLRLHWAGSKHYHVAFRIRQLWNLCFWLAYSVIIGSILDPANTHPITNFLPPTRKDASEIWTCEDEIPNFSGAIYYQYLERLQTSFKNAVGTGGALWLVLVLMACKTQPPIMSRENATILFAKLHDHTILKPSPLHNS
jgi:hypothetical protein